MNNLKEVKEIIDKHLDEEDRSCEKLKFDEVEKGNIKSPTKLLDLIDALTVKKMNILFACSMWKTIVALKILQESLCIKKIPKSHFSRNEYVRNGMRDLISLDMISVEEFHFGKFRTSKVSVNKSGEEFIEFVWNLFEGFFESNSPDSYKLMTEAIEKIKQDRSLDVPEDEKDFEAELLRKSIEQKKEFFAKRLSIGGQLTPTKGLLIVDREPFHPYENVRGQIKKIFGIEKKDVNECN